jgi:hypothetical protein
LVWTLSPLTDVDLDAANRVVQFGTTPDGVVQVLAADRKVADRNTESNSEIIAFQDISDEL